MCLHTDKAAARETLRRIRVLEEAYGAKVAFAHDEQWLVEGTDEVLMGIVDEEIIEAARVRIPKGEVV